MKLLFKIILISIFIILPANAEKSIRGLDAYEWGKIDASKNARLHSNMGNIYFDEKNYQGAIKEYEIAYNLTANTSGSSVYLYNLARCYMKLNQYKLAKNALEGAIEKDCINMTYYETLAECIYALHAENKELNKYLKDDSNPYNRIMAGLIYLYGGSKTEARTIFDEFITAYPDMIITNDVKVLINRL